MRGEPVTEERGGGGLVVGGAVDANSAVNSARGVGVGSPFPMQHLACVVRVIHYLGVGQHVSQRDPFAEPSLALVTVEVGRHVVLHVTVRVQRAAELGAGLGLGQGQAAQAAPAHPLVPGSLCLVLGAQGAGISQLAQTKCLRTIHTAARSLVLSWNTQR